MNILLEQLLMSEFTFALVIVFLLVYMIKNKAAHSDTIGDFGRLISST